MVGVGVWKKYMNGRMLIEGGAESFCTLWCCYMLRKTGEGTATYTIQLVKYIVLLNILYIVKLLFFKKTPHCK